MTHHTGTAEPKRQRFRFFRDIVSELKKVVWLSRREAIYLTFLVLSVSLAVGVILGVFDYAFARLIFFLGK